VFIGTIEGESDQTSETSETPEPAEPLEPLKIRGSARGIPEFDVFEALQYCRDLLGKFGGHRAAGGFTFEAANLEAVRERLREFADQWLSPEQLKPLVTIDARADFRDLTLELYEQMDVLHPCGIENPDPVFWTPNVRVVEQRQIGQNQAHLKVTLSQIADPSYSLRAIAWRWGGYYPLPNPIDVAYKLRLNEWQGVRSVELELVGLRASQSPEKSSESSDHARLEPLAMPKLYPAAQLPLEPDSSKTAHLEIVGHRHRVKQVAVDVAVDLEYVPEEISERESEPVSDHIVQSIPQSSLTIATPESIQIRDLEQVIHQKDQQIASLTQQVELLHQQIEQLQLFQQLAQPAPLAVEFQPLLESLSEFKSEPESEPELALPQLKAEDPKPWLKAKLGELVWNSLDSRSQKDLIAAYKKYALIQASVDAELSSDAALDYSDVGLRLCSVIEREVIQPFFKELHQFLLAAGEPCEIGGISLRARKKYTLGMLPPLLAVEWQSFQEEALNGDGTDELYSLITAVQVDSADRETVQIFLAQWEHPLARWLNCPDLQTMASTLAQIDRLLTLAADAESQLCDWQFQHLQRLIMGAESVGLLHQVYAVASGHCLTD